MKSRLFSSTTCINQLCFVLPAGSGTWRAPAGNEETGKAEQRRSGGSLGSSPAPHSSPPKAWLLAPNDYIPFFLFGNIFVSDSMFDRGFVLVSGTVCSHLCSA